MEMGMTHHYLSHFLEYHTSTTRYNNSMPRNFQNYGEAVVLPVQGTTNLFLHQIEQNKRNEAMLNKQIQDNLATYDPNKIRDVDLDGFYSRYNKLKQLSIKNKDAIKAPAKNPDKIREIDAAKNDLVAFMAKSKSAKDFQKQVDDFYTKNAGKVNLPDFIDKRKLVSSAVDSPDYNKAQGLNITDFQFNPAKFDAPKFYEPVYKANPMAIIEDQKTGPNGEILVTKNRKRDIEGTMRSIDLNYQATPAAQIFFEDALAKTSPEDISALSSTMQKIVPGFEVNNGKDLAVALGMVGKMQVSGSPVQKGYTMAAQEAKSRRLQDRAAAISENAYTNRQAVKAGFDKNKKQQWIPLMSQAMKTNDPDMIQNYIGELSDAAPGVEYGYINREIYNQDRVKNKELVKTIVSGRASDRDILKPDDVNRGFIYVKVPTGKDSKGNAKYKYMVASPSRKDLPNSLNRILNAARGVKKFGSATEYEPVFAPGSLDDADDENPEGDE